MALCTHAHVSPPGEMRKDSPYYHGTIMCQQPPTDSTVATVPTVAAFTAVELEFRNNLSNYSNYRIHRLVPESQEQPDDHVRTCVIIGLPE